VLVSGELFCRQREAVTRPFRLQPRGPCQGEVMECNEDSLSSAVKIMMDLFPKDNTGKLCEADNFSFLIADVCHLHVSL